MLAFWTLAAAAAVAARAARAAPAPAASAAEVRVAVTYYAAVAERDFGDAATEPAEWRLDGSTVVHRSLFAPGFASRDVEDPKRPGLLGAAMEGAGLIDITLHEGDDPLKAAWDAGYRVLSLESWDRRRRKAFFVLAKSPRTATGEAVAGRSAAVRRGNALFPLGSEVEVRCPGRAPERRLIDDTCSSCRSDAHLDLYVAPERVRDGIFRCRARRLKPRRASRRGPAPARNATGRSAAWPARR